MVEYLTNVIRGQFEASLCMLRQCVQTCPREQWECRIANGTFRWVAYHTLFFVDLYLSPDEAAFIPCDLTARGGDERHPKLSPGLSPEDTLAYIAHCRRKALDTLAAETRESLERSSGFSWVPLTRGELHLYNIRHIQHHTGQLSACLRRLDPDLRGAKALSWVHSGWR